MSRVYVLSIDGGDNADVREALSHKDLLVCAVDAQDTRADALLSQRDDCVVVSIDRLDVSAEAAIAEICACWRAPVVVVATRADVATVVRVMKSGVRDVLERKNLPEALRTIIMNGREVRTGGVAQAVAARHRVQILAPRELEIFDAIATGETSRAIASRLGLSIRTVEAYRARIMAKLRLNTLPELVRLAVLSKY